MMGEAANEAIMVLGKKSHLSLQAPANRAGSAADVARPEETELTLIA